MKFRVLIEMHPEDVKMLTPRTSRRAVRHAVADFVRECVDLHGLSVLSSADDRHDDYEEADDV